MKYLILHTTFLNNGFWLDIVRISIKILTVILKSSMEGSDSHFFDVGLGSFLCYVEEKSILFFFFFYSSYDKKNNKSLNQNS